MRNYFTKIPIIIGLGIIIYSCDAVKKVPDDELLLTKNIIEVNDNVNKEVGPESQLYQEPNKAILGVNFRLHLYNLAKENSDSLYNDWLHRKPNRYKFLSSILSEKQVERLGSSFLVSGYNDFLKNSGEPPVIIDKSKIDRSVQRLKNYYFSQGYFNVKSTYEIDTVGVKKGKVTYKVNTGDPYKIDSINVEIETPALDSLYQSTKSSSLIKKGEQYNRSNFDAERDRITTYFRNRGAYFFEQNYINYVIDTVDTGKKANVNIIISNQNERSGDSTYVRPFSLYKISRVNIFSNNPYNKDNQNDIDSLVYNDFNFYSSGKFQFKPKAITDAIFINKGKDYSDIRDMVTRKYLDNLNMFGYPRIEYVEDPADSTRSSLITNIYLNSLKKRHFRALVDLTHSNIQDFGIEGNTSLSIRNIFKGAEILEIALRGNVGSSKDMSNPDNVFFNILEYGANVKLSIPRILFPFNTDKIIPKSMIPSTLMSFGFSKQQNIGLDKESFTGVINYNWSPKRLVNMKMDILNIQYIKNINASNYFNVYNSSYSRLNDLAQEYGTNPVYLDENGNLTREEGTAGFINDVLSGGSDIPANSTDYKIVNSIEERRKRLTENNLIVAANYSYSKSTKTNLYDNDFYMFKAKVETAGNALSLISGLTSTEKSENDKYNILNLEFSQYAKTELEFIKHWDLQRKQVLALRLFGGLAVPYGNSTNIPFSKSYFAGGSNDNRGWQSYSLGPGSSGGLNDFNEANMKLSGSLEYRFKLLGNLNSALFVDAGNIWNTLDDTDDPDYTFTGFKSLKNIAVGSGFGLRYDFGFVILRLDFGFKTYNPAKNFDNRWFKGYNFSKSVINIGINYPF